MAVGSASSAVRSAVVKGVTTTSKSEPPGRVVTCGRLPRHSEATLGSDMTEDRDLPSDNEAEPPDEARWAAERIQEI